MSDTIGKLILLVGVSGSGKTTIQEKLIKEYGWTRPLNFTTRKPRTKDIYTKVDMEGDFKSEELSEYIYLTQPQFVKKIVNGDLAEFTYYNGNFYGVSRFIDYSKDNIIIVEPCGLAVFKKKFLIEDRNFTTIYLNITLETQEERLGVLRRESVVTITERKKDFKYFPQNRYDIVLDGEENINTNIRKILDI